MLQHKNILQTSIQVFESFNPFGDALRYRAASTRRLFKDLGIDKSTAVDNINASAPFVLWDILHNLFFINFFLL
jgi:hypothetical protein